MHNYFSALNLLRLPGSPIRSYEKDIWFFYARRRAQSTCCTVLHVDTKSAGQNLPVIGYLYYMSVVRDRQWLLTHPRHPTLEHNWPVKRLFDCRLRKATPENWTEDPYLVFALLSLAQAQRHKDKSSKSATFPVRLFVTKDKDTHFAHVFHADINAHILDALDEPTLNLNAVEWPTITLTKVPFEPSLTFPDRILAELLGSHMVETATNDARKSRVKKRKHEDDMESPTKMSKIMS
ncbi:hypothetical protein IL306_012173 [Fusarium sp. DS 682]|nr:hypothetical protein IL306_012173 [Fusarium sp. DS 682]